MPDMISVVYEKSSGQVLGVVKRTGQPDGTGDALVIAAPGVVVRDTTSWTVVVTVPASELGVQALDTNSFSALLPNPKKYQIVDGLPVLVATASGATANAAQVNFANAAPAAGKTVGVYLQIEGGSLPEPIKWAFQSTIANYIFPLPPLTTGSYRVLILSAGRLPKTDVIPVP